MSPFSSTVGGVCNPKEDRAAASQRRIIDHADISSAPGPTPPVITSPLFRLVTLLVPLPPTDTFLLVSTDFISSLIKYLPCLATNYKLHLHTTGEDSGCFHKLPVKSPELGKNMAKALHHNICLVRPLNAADIHIIKRTSFYSK